MPACISEVEINGEKIAEAMYANRPAWHKLGKVWRPGEKTAPDSATAAKLSHMTWNVKKEACVRNGTVVPGHFWTVREDTNTVLGHVGPEYKIHQNWEALRFLDSFVMDGIMRYEAVFALHGGKEVVFLARMPSVDVFAQGDYGLRYILWKISHHGLSPIVGCPTSVRAECANMTAMALSQAGRLKVKVRHSGDMEVKLEDAKKYLSQFDKGFSLFRDNAQVLATRRYSPADAAAYIESLFPTPEKEGRGLTIRTNKVKEVRAGFTHASNTLPSIKGTWWALYNAVSFAIDHGEKFAARGDEAVRDERRFVSISDGTGADFKQAAFDLACSMAGLKLAAAA